MIAGAAPVSRARLGVTLAAFAAAIALGPLTARLVALDVAALATLGGTFALAGLAWAGVRRLDLVLLAANVMAIALLPAIHHRGPLDVPGPSPFYDWALLRVTAPELLAAAALIADWMRRQTSAAAPARVGPVPLLALIFLALGLLVGLARGTGLDAALRDGRKLAYIALAHWLVVRVADDPKRRRVLAVCLFAALAARAVATVVGFLADRGFHYRGFLRASVDVGDFLGFLALIYLPAAQLRTRATRGRERLLLVSLIVLGAAATLATFSRAAWCAAPIGIGVVLLHKVRAARPMPRALVAVALVGAIAAPIAFGGMAERAIARLAPLLSPAADSSVSYRLRELRGAAEVVADHPVCGLGLGTPFDAGAPLIDRRRGAQTLVHNVFLWSALKAGLAGLLLVAAMIAIPATRLSRSARSLADPGQAGGALGLFALLAAFVVLGLVGALLNQARVAFALGLISGFAQLLAQERPRNAQAGAPAREGGR